MASTCVFYVAEKKNPFGQMCYGISGILVCLYVGPLLFILCLLPRTPSLRPYLDLGKKNNKHLEGILQDGDIYYFDKSIGLLFRISVDTSGLEIVGMVHESRRHIFLSLRCFG